MSDSKSTDLIHHPYQAPGDFESPVVPVCKGSTVYFPNMAALRQRQWVDKSAYTYGLHGTPTTFTLEARLATLEGAQHVLLAPSGLSAITVVNMGLLKAGDTLLLPDNVYNPSKDFARHEMAAWGIGHRLYDAMQPESLAQALDETVKLVWLEAPGSVTLEFPDLPALVRTVREKAPQAVIALDNTWGAGLAFDAFALGEGLGVDLTIHALTKYPSGGGDVLMGSVACRDTALYEKLAWTHSRLGLGVGANDVELVLRNLPSLPLRYAAQDAAARRIAAWAQTQPQVARVLHPALPDSPGHAHWAALCRAAAGLLTLEMDPRFSAAQVDSFVDGLQRFRIGWSWGGPVSLAVPYQGGAMRKLGSPYRGTLVRLCIGLEAVDDLIADLAAGLARLDGR
ncbi:cystathionine beta-lyase [Ideonella dechloratans]|uniref:Cystathionine beta-lyase n=1 Tax=Ideonella dechloratans TaxID=36863 RepID=A0A643FDA6_IDEDE|nr:PLP-dependent transferase [Ideonella dechloratans]KAB0580945.1 cystathionine beta-lyase [Ideonella dechloratans]UFU08803.1 PLP-dependent transferase [Ideonella dechloratans]